MENTARARLLPALSRLIAAAEELVAIAEELERDLDPVPPAPVVITEEAQ